MLGRNGKTEADNSEIRKPVNRRTVKDQPIDAGDAEHRSDTHADEGALQWLIRLPTAAPATMAARAQMNAQISALT